jgi:pimeloyl-ACP methyl ester carboxylesterase
VFVVPETNSDVLDGSVEDGHAPLVITVAAPHGPTQVRVWPATDPRHRPVLLACHDWTESGEVFEHLAQALDRRWTVIAPDAPGHGGTPWHEADRYHVADPLPATEAVLDRLPRLAGRAAPVVAFGHGVGALTATLMARSRPETVRHLVLEDPARSTPRRVPPRSRYRTLLYRLQGLDEDGLTAWTQRTYPDWPTPEHRSWARAIRSVDPALMDVPADWGEPLIALLADLSVPVTLIRGEPARGGWVSATAADRCAGVVAAGAEVVALPAGHHPRRQAGPEAFAAVVTALDSCDRPPTGPHPSAPSRSRRRRHHPG